MAVSAGNTTKVLIPGAVLFLCSLAMTHYTAHHARPGRIGSAVVAELLSPFQVVSSSLRRGVYGWWDQYIALLDVNRENEQLTRRLTVLEAENSRLRELENENRRLEKVVALERETGFTGVAANVVAYDPSNWVRSVTIDKGQADGVQVGMAVLEGYGVVGQVVASGVHSASVLLLTDHSSGVDAVIQNSRVRGVVEGAGSFKAHWNYVLVDEDVKVGDRVITSGMDGVYPKGLLVGVVVFLGDEQPGKLFHSIDIEPSVNFAKLESVFVVTKAPAERSGTAKQEEAQGEGDGQS